MKHLLKEHGILSAFSIRQKITSDEFFQIYKEIESNSKSEEDIQRKFQKLMDENSMQNIPGTINPNEEQLRVQELVERARLLSTFIKKDPDITKKEMLVMFHAMAKHLGILIESDDNQ